MEAVGMLEVFGLVCAMVAADAGCKAGNVTIEAMDKNKPRRPSPSWRPFKRVSLGFLIWRNRSRKRWMAVR